MKKSPFVFLLLCFRFFVLFFFDYPLNIIVHSSFHIFHQNRGRIDTISSWNSRFLVDTVAFLSLVETILNLVSGSNRWENITDGRRTANRSQPPLPMNESHDWMNLGLNGDLKTPRWKEWSRKMDTWPAFPITQPTLLSSNFMVATHQLLATVATVIMLRTRTTVTTMNPNKTGIIGTVDLKGELRFETFKLTNLCQSLTDGCYFRRRLQGDKGLACNSI